MTIKILNLYAGIGGNRKLWDGDIEVTAIENVPEIAKIYQDFFPEDKVIVTDAHQYLIEHYKEFDFIWSSPPCPTHSRMRLNHKIKVYPDMRLYQEIIFLKHNFKGKWVVENVISYYKPLIEPRVLHRHFFWSNFELGDFIVGGINVAKTTKEELAKFHGFPITKRLFLRNCVYPPLGEYIFNMAFKNKQKELIC